MRHLLSIVARITFTGLAGGLLVGPASSQLGKGVPQKPQVPRYPKGYFEAPGPQQRGWYKVPVTAMQIATATDAKLRKLANHAAIAQATFEVNGGHGVGNLKIAVKSPTVFHVEYLTLGGRQQDASPDQMVADGKRFAMLTRPGWSIPVPLAGRSDGRVADPVAAWPRAFSRLMFAGIGSKATPWADFVKAASRPGSGLEVFAEQRRMVYGGRAITNHRILVRRKATAAKKRGRMYVELVVDALLKLPVTVRAAVEPPGKTPTRTVWRCSWGRPKTPFSSSLFVLPKARAARKK